MIFFALALFALAAFLVLTQRDKHPNLQQMGRYFRVASFILLALGFFTSCFVQIEAGYIGVKSLFGKIQEDVLYPGLHVINPLLTITQMDTKTQNYTMSGVHDEGTKSGDDAIRALTKDGLEVVIDVTVLYRIIANSAPKIINETGVDYQDKVIRPTARTKIRDYTVYYDAVELYSSKRDAFQLQIFKSIEVDFASRGLVLEQLMVRNISLPTPVKTAIEDKIRAEQDAQKMQFVLQKERQEAERKRVEAQGIADYQKIINTGLTDKQLEYEMIKAYKELATSQNAKVIVMNGKNAPLLINGN